MRRWVGFLGSWALFVLGFGLFAFAAAGEYINIRDLHRFDRLGVIDAMIQEKSGGKTAQLRAAAEKRASEVSALSNRVSTAQHQIDDRPDTGQTIVVSTEENRLYLRRNGSVVFQAVCSTGKGTTLAADGKTFVFDTPIGRFHIKAKEENPQWVPPEWHFIEEAQRNGMRVVHLNPGGAIDADTGEPVLNNDDGVWSWFGGNRRRVMKVKGNTVVIDEGGGERELPPGKLIVAGNAVVVPPINTVQRHFDKVLGHYRLELGDGYGIHGTDEPDKLGHSVSHGCVRLGDADIEQLYQLANVGDEVIIY